MSLFSEVDVAVFIDTNGKIYTSYVPEKDESAINYSGLKPVVPPETRAGSIKVVRAVKLRIGL